MRRPRLLALGSVGLAAVLAVAPGASAQGVSGQGVATAGGDEDPGAVAHDFLRALESMAWDAVAARLHPAALDRVHDVVTMLVETDARGEVPERLLGGLAREDYAALEAPEVFRRVMTALMEETPGLVHALVSRRHEVVGPVPEGPDTAHVVYRVRPTLQGARPAVEVMTLARTPGRDGAKGPWRVLRSDELDAVGAALRGIPVGRPPPTPPPADTARTPGGGREG